MPIAIVWLRADLRLNDNPALNYAVEQGYQVLPVVINDQNRGRPLGQAATWWRNKNIAQVAQDIEKQGGYLYIEQGDTETILTTLIEKTGVTAVFWNRVYEPAVCEADKSLKQALKDKGLTVKSFGGNVLFEPFAIQTGQGTPFKVFTPFWKACLKAEEHIKTVFCSSISWVSGADLEQKGLKISEKFTFETPFWAKDMDALWSAGEESAAEKLENFVDRTINGYAEGRDFPSVATSGLSPYLAVGAISPRQIWVYVKTALFHGKIGEKDAYKFLTELAWRDFSYHVGYFYPDLATKSVQEKFEGMPWRWDEQAQAEFKRWTQGQTGCPLVDAGMRQLWQTGWMHNRIRMVVGSFLVKHLLIDWRYGEEWFWDTLIDADWASNTANWQWVAGCGFDAAPYFRIFNPVLQGERFDKDGQYIHTFVPQVSKLPAPLVHKPWEASLKDLALAGIKLGDTYPTLCVDLKEGRDRALNALSSLNK